jgi:hypothetical protein
MPRAESASATRRALGCRSSISDTSLCHAQEMLTNELKITRKT